MRPCVRLSDQIRERRDDATQELALRPAEQVAAEVVRVLDLIAERLQLETPHPATARRVRGARTVPRDFVVSLIAAAEQGTDLPGIGKFDPAGAREAMESSAACRLVAERMAMLVAKLNYTAEARWAKVVADAMNAFTMASIFARDAAAIGQEGHAEEKERREEEDAYGLRTGGGQAILPVLSRRRTH